ncbi:hypothetical protein D9X30_5828 [Cupriavidus sp. U2]|nr:hypothetical protein D9X30_5828 [Cupriavidus sp. U2]
MSLALGAQDFPDLAPHFVRFIMQLSSMVHLTPYRADSSDVMSTIIDIQFYVNFF